MAAVSNTSPISNLAIIDQLSLLHQQFGKVLIPPAVLEELRADHNLPGSNAVRQAIEADQLQVQDVKDRTLVKVLRHDLDNGEAEAITLALQTKADWTLLDERDGRKLAKSLGLKVTGVLGILLRAKQDGHLSSLQDAMEQLREKAGFHIGTELYADVIRRGRERETS